MKAGRAFSTIGVCAVLSACGGGEGTTSPRTTDPLATSIREIQGRGESGPLAGRAVTVTGIVSGDFQDHDADIDNNLGGFYLQSPNPDADPGTSEGVFVLDRTTPAIDVSVGDRVTVTGTAQEYFGETQLVATELAVSGAGSIEAVDISLPADLEHYEGMLIRLPQALTVTELYELERFGTIGLATGGRVFAFTNQNAPDVAGYAAHQADVAGRSILLDDGRLDEYITPVRYLQAGHAPVHSVRAGDSIAGLTGNLRFARGSGSSGTEGYRLMPTVEPQFVAQNPRPDAPVMAGVLRVVSFNALNLFSTIDSGIDRCGPFGAGRCRGADSAEELERQLAKLVAALSMLDADVIGLVEIENNAGTALQMIVDRLNLVSGHHYDSVHSGVLGSDVIATGFLYRTAAVGLRGVPAVLDSSVDARFDSALNRPALAQAFVQIADGAVFSVVVNHLKSKGSSCDDVGDPDINDGQGNCNITRSRAASALADWIGSDPTGSGDSDYLVIGDLNAYTYEDPLTILKTAGFTSLLEDTAGAEAWSFIFAGQSGALDHALASASLASQVAGVVEWHINADEPAALDYNTEHGRDAALFDPGEPWRASDHDPLLIGLNLSR